MIYRFIDNNSEQRDLIENVLEAYCVPSKRIVHKAFCALGITCTYDIEVDLNVEETMRDKDGNPISPLDFIKGKVEERLALEECFEDSEELSYKITNDSIKKHIENIQEKNDFINNVFKDVPFKEEKPKKSIFRSILDKLQKKPTIDDLFLGLATDKEVLKHANSMEELDDYLKKSGKKDKLSNAISNLVNPQKSIKDFLEKPKDSVLDIINDMRADKNKHANKKKYADRLKKLAKDTDVFGDAIKGISEILGKPFAERIKDLMDKTDNSGWVSYDALPKQLQKELLNQFPENLLKTRCKFKVHFGEAGAVAVSIEIDGRDLN